jgi:hypothetical protein
MFDLDFDVAHDAHPAPRGVPLRLVMVPCRLEVVWSRRYCALHANGFDSGDGCALRFHLVPVERATPAIRAWVNDLEQRTVVRRWS